MTDTSDIYFTILKRGEGFYKEKGSKFLGFAIPCMDSNQAKKFIEGFRKEHHGACHVCFAWRFGTEKHEDRYSDDGEPNNSAGKPIFGQLLSADITNTLIAVVRYYGGTNLGVGGLITAYKTAAKEAISNTKIEKRYIQNTYKIEHSFANTGPVMGALNKINAEIKEQLFENNNPAIIFNIRKSKAKEVETIFGAMPTITITSLKTI